MMWSDGFLFAFAALTAIGVWISIGLRHSAHMRARGRRSRGPDERLRIYLGRNSLWIVLAAASAIFVLHSVSAGVEHGLAWPSIGAIISLLVGGMVGSFSARFTWSLFGARFGSRDPLIGITIIGILVIIYSLPLYQEQFSIIWAGLGLKSLKAPGGVELTFSETPPIRSGIITSANNAQQEMPSSVSNPNNPQPGLNGLDSVVSNDENSYIIRDDRYIAYFRGYPIPVLDSNQTQFIPSNPVLRDTAQFLVPGKTLVGCLRQYVSIFPDSQLVLVDTKPVIQWLFRLHAYGKQQLKLTKSTSFDNSNELSDAFGQAVNQVRTNVLIALGVDSAPTSLLAGKPNAVVAQDMEGEARRYAASVQDGELAKAPALLRLLGQGPPKGDLGLLPVDRFVVGCNKAQLGGRRLAEGASLQILQPYTSIALANLLVAHGSPDEAIIVLTEWLDLWRCARGKLDALDLPGRGGRQGIKSQAGGCEISVNAEAQELPEWLGFRAEFELSVILFRLAGEGNIAYRDFMGNLLPRFQRYLEKPVVLATTASEGVNRSISIGTEAQACTSQHQLNLSRVGNLGADHNAGEVKEVRTALLRTLVGGENTFLRSELHFVSELGVPDLENLYERGILLSEFTPECLDPENRDNKLGKVWVPAVADYQITAGLLALAIADRYQSLAVSTDERQRALDIRAEGKRLVERGYRSLKPIRDAERTALAGALLRDRVFTVSSWEESCLLAERALEQLRRSGF